jgi:hypothetical protein
VAHPLLDVPASDLPSDLTAIAALTATLVDR